MQSMRSELSATETRSKGLDWLLAGEDKIETGGSEGDTTCPRGRYHHQLDRGSNPVNPRAYSRTGILPYQDSPHTPLDTFTHLYPYVCTQSTYLPRASRTFLTCIIWQRG